MLGGVAEKPHKVMQIRNERFRDTSFVRLDAPVDETGFTWKRTVSAHRSSHRSDFWPDRISLGRCNRGELVTELQGLLKSCSQPLRVRRFAQPIAANAKVGAPTEPLVRRRAFGMTRECVAVET
jgi:hypothetical protein